MYVTDIEIVCLARQRFRHAHGQSFVRLDATSSIYPQTAWRLYPGSFTFGVIFNAILLGEPFVMLKELNGVMVDGMMLLAGRKALLERLVNQWAQLLVLVRRNSPLLGLRYKLRISRELSCSLSTCPSSPFQA